MCKLLFFFHFSLALSFALQLSSAVEPPIEQASHNASTTPQQSVARGEVITFSQQPTQVGDRVAQRVGMEFNLRTIIKQSGQVANDSEIAMRTRQQRQIEVLEVSGGQARRARVSYPLARQMTPENPDPDSEIAQVVEGKTYLVTRAGEQLQITDSEGAIPTRKEFEIVLGSMENFGKPNPLAEYLLAQKIRVGDKLNVPLEIAAGMMGFDKMGGVKKFELCLEHLREVDGKKCAVFSATIITAASTESPLNVVATGTAAIEIATARTIEATLEGPVKMAANENGVHYDTTGNLLMAIQSYYNSP